MKRLIADMDALEAKHGYLVGDLNTDGVLNTAYQLYGQDLFSVFTKRRIARGVCSTSSAS